MSGISSYCCSMIKVYLNVSIGDISLCRWLFHWFISLVYAKTKLLKMVCFFPSLSPSFPNAHNRSITCLFSISPMIWLYFCLVHIKGTKRKIIQFFFVHSFEKTHFSSCRSVFPIRIDWVRIIYNSSIELMLRFFTNVWPGLKKCSIFLNHH